MGEKIVWTCDGCDEERVMNGTPTDWRKISVTFRGFKGYPVGDYADGDTHYNLCPHCQRALWEKGRPTNWPRAARAVGANP